MIEIKNLIKHIIFYIIKLLEKIYPYRCTVDKTTYNNPKSLYQAMFQLKKYFSTTKKKS